MKFKVGIIGCGLIGKKDLKILEITVMLHLYVIKIYIKLKN